MEVEISNDKLSKLPDDVIRLILSWLSLTDAVKTSILSRRWRHLWMTLHNLSFIGYDIVEGYHPRAVFLKRIYTKKFVTFVNNFLGQHVGYGIEAFKICFAFDNDHKEQLDQWINFSIKSGAKDIELLVEKGWMPSYDSSYKLPLQLFSSGAASSLVRLCLRNCIMCPLPHLDNFRSLKELSMDAVTVSHDVLNSILSECFVLEKLCLRFCPHIADLKIYSTSSQLKYLNICNCVQLKRIELFQLNLIEFNYFGKWTSIVVHDLPKLLRFTIAFESPVTEPCLTSLLVTLSSVAPHLRSLMWTFADPIQEQYLQHARNLSFANLKYLELCIWVSPTRNLDWVVFLLGIIPLLEKLALDFVLMFEDQHQVGDILKVPKLPHKHLKEVEIHGYLGFANQKALMTCIMNNASSLKLIKLSHSFKLFREDSIWMRKEKGLEAEYFFGRAFQDLYKNAPPGVKLVEISYCVEEALPLRSCPV